MKFKVGDKVKFLNEKGGGIVSKIISHSLVQVTIEEGFDIPVVPSELVLDVSHNESQSERRPQNVEPIENRIVLQEPDTQEEDANKSSIKKLGFRGEWAEGIYMAYVPHDQRWLMTGAIDLYLLNYTGLDVLYSIFLQDNTGYYNGLDYDVLEPRTKVLIASFEREKIEDWTKGLVQIIFHVEKTAKLPVPGNIPIHIKPARLYKEGNYKETPLLDEKAFVINLVTLNQHQKVESQDLKYDPVHDTPTLTKEKKVKALIDKHQTGDKEAVVDLHIGELVNNITGLTSHDMLNIQKDYFIQTLESAIQEDYERVTFIHGVGNGVLKDELVKALTQYEITSNQAASLAKYGVGAIDVLIRKQ